MAKKKKAGAAGRPKLPKEIAGIKIGKGLRNAVEPVLEWASHPAVSETLAAAIVAGAGALGSAKKGAAVKSTTTPEAGSKSGVALSLAIAAGEIASRILASYEAGEAAKAPAPRPAKPKARGPGRPRKK